MIIDAHRIQAIDLFLDKCNTDLLSKEELIIGIRTILGTESITPEAKELYADALELVYRGKK